MLKFSTGDLLNADVEALVNTVNCVGVMGRGVALQVKNAFPENFKAYARACDLGEVQPGRMFVFETREMTNPKYIINFPTKRHWRGKSRMEDIESGLVDLRRVIAQRHIRSIALPPLGSGLGGLPWSEVRTRIAAALADIEGLTAVIFEPLPKGAEPVNNSRPVPKMTKGRAALVLLVTHYLGALMDPVVSLLEVHKLMYLLQVSGVNLKLRYKAALYGPYAENLRHVLNDIEGHLISGYANGGDNPDKLLELVPGATKDSELFLPSDDSTRQHIARVVDLVQGFETSFGLELLATVHWAAQESQAPNVARAIDATYAWNDRKRKMFSREQIALAYDVLKAKGWLSIAH